MRIALVALSPLASDSRVLRTARALSEAGHAVLLIGHGPAPEAGAFEVALLPGPPSPLLIRAGIVLRQAPATLLPASAPVLYWCSAARRRARALVEAFRPDVVHANDWNTLPIGLAAKRRCGSRLVYDSHEMAVAEFEESLKWRLVALAHVRALEARGMAAADAVIAVSPGIAEALAQAYPGAPSPVVIRNVPDQEAVPFRPAGETVEVLFHGFLRPNRGIEPLIDAVAAWRPEFRLVLRGSGAPAYAAALKGRAQAAGVADRVRLEGPVPAREVVAAASRSDLGVVVLPDTSRHNRFALPNKLFEYLAAGLGVIVSPVPDMAQIVRDRGCGVVAEPDPASIARAVNGLDRPAIDALKRRALAAAQDLSWTREKPKLIALYDRLAPPAGGERS